MKYIKIENKSENKTADNSKILKAYKDEVNKFARKIETDEISVAEYFLYDIDHDGIIDDYEIKEEKVMEPIEFPQGQDYIEYESIPYYNYDDDTGFKICA